MRIVVRRGYHVCAAALIGCALSATASAQQLPSPWTSADVGAPMLAGSARLHQSTFVVDGAGADIGGTADQFHFVYQQITGDVELVARVDSLVQADPWTKAGVMIRASLNAGAANAAAIVSSTQGLHFQRRPAAGQGTVGTAGPGVAAPVWLRVVRSGTTVTASSSSNGTSWTTIGSGTVALESSAYVGVGVTSHNINTRSTGRFSSVAVRPLGSAPSTMQSIDIGAPPIAGRTTVSGGTYTVQASGRDIWDSADQFHFVYQPVTGDTEIIARLASLTNTDPWAKAGVMVREALTADSRHALMALTIGNGHAFQRRAAQGAQSLHTDGGSGTTPGWVRLVRTGDLFQAYRSSNGTTWTSVGTDTIAMGATVYVGLAVTSHNTSASTTATIDNLTIRSTGTGNQNPAVSITQPVSGGSYQVPASLTITANASDPENRMMSVDFFANGTLIARDTTAPYSTGWSSSTPGTYSLTATAYDGDGGSSSSSPVTVTVNATNQAPTVSLTAPSNGATFSAPATITLNANASDPEGQLARVEFFSGSSRLGTDTTAPYSFTWSNVPAGSYALTAVAFDSSGASATSSSVNITLQGTTTGLPDNQTGADIGAPAVAGQSTHANGTYTIRAGGRDIWDADDQFHFMYRPVTGNIDIRARIGGLTNTDPWAKAGVMVRENLTTGSRHALMAVTIANGYAFQHRSTQSGQSSHTAGGSGTVPGWVRLVRTGDLFQAYRSSDGINWTLAGSDTIAMSAAVYVGIGVTSHNTSTATTATVDGLTVTVPTGGNQPPSVTLTAPAAGAQYTAPASITISANASDPEGQLARVEFYSGTTLLSSDASAPYSFTWSSVPAGSYGLRAVAYDSAGATATTATLNVTVSPSSSSAPKTVAFTASSDHATKVTSYLLSVFRQGADPATSTPVATSDLGKPTPTSNNEISVDRATFFSALQSGTYAATITAIGPGGQTRSAPVSFTR